MPCRLVGFVSSRGEAALAGITSLWLPLHVLSFTTSFLWLTVMQLFVEQCLRAHTSPVNILRSICQCKQLSKLLTSNPISLGFLRCLSVFALPFCNMFEYDQSLKSSVIKSSARQFETCRVYFIMGCSDSRRAILVTVAAAVCVLAWGTFSIVTPKINKERDMCVCVCVFGCLCLCFCEYICWNK